MANRKARRRALVGFQRLRNKLTATVGSLLRRTTPEPPVIHEDPLEAEFVNGVHAIFEDSLTKIGQQTADIRERVENEAEELRLLLQKPADEKNWARIGELQSSFKTLSGQLTQLEHDRRRLNVPDAATLAAQYREIMSIPRVLSVGVKSTRITFTTDVLYGKGHTDAWHRIGSFEVNFSVHDRTIRAFLWSNLDGPKDGYHGPPNIHGTSKYASVSCAGRIADAIIAKAADERDFATLVRFAVRYPECKGQAMHDRIARWPTVAVRDVPKWYIETFGK